MRLKSQGILWAGLILTVSTNGLALGFDCVQAILKMGFEFRELHLGAAVSRMALAGETQLRRVVRIDEGILKSRQFLAHTRGNEIILYIPKKGAPGYRYLGSVPFPGDYKNLDIFPFASAFMLAVRADRGLFLYRLYSNKIAPTPDHIAFPAGVTAYQTFQKKQGLVFGFYFVLATRGHIQVFLANSDSARGKIIKVAEIATEGRSEGLAISDLENSRAHPASTRFSIFSLEETHIRHFIYQERYSQDPVLELESSFGHREVSTAESDALATIRQLPPSPEAAETIPVMCLAATRGSACYGREVGEELSNRIVAMGRRSRARFFAQHRGGFRELPSLDTDGQIISLVAATPGTVYIGDLRRGESDARENGRFVIHTTEGKLLLVELFGAHHPVVVETASVEIPFSPPASRELGFTEPR